MRRELIATALMLTIASLALAQTNLLECNISKTENCLTKESCLNAGAVWEESIIGGYQPGITLNGKCYPSLTNNLCIQSELIQCYYYGVTKEYCLKALPSRSTSFLTAKESNSLNNYCVIDAPEGNCDTQNLNYCVLENDCEQAEGTWCRLICTNGYECYDYCSDTNACDGCAIGYPIKCTSQDTCNLAGGTWCNDNCRESIQDCQCTSSTIQYCTTQAKCENAGLYWCNNACQATTCIKTCTALQGECCDTTQACSGTNTQSSDCQSCCIGKCITPCTSNNLTTCITNLTCTNAGGNWCDNKCQTTQCIKTKTCASLNGTCCSLTCTGNITAASDCINCCTGECLNNEALCKKNQGNWCDMQCMNTPCPTCATNNTYCKTKTECTQNNWNWCNDECTNKSCNTQCTTLNINSCITETTCLTTGGYWCSNTCTTTPCTCKLNPSYCTSKTDCLNNKFNWCYNYDKNNYYCINQTCPKTCSPETMNSCTSEQSCNNIGGHWCGGNNCINTTCPIICANEGGTCCNKTCNGTLTKTTDCNCCMGTCTEQPTTASTKCEGNNNCKTNPNTCACGNNYECNPSSEKSLPNGCVQTEQRASTYVCGDNDNCLTNPACKCNPGDDCKPGNELADKKGCVILNTCTNCCGDGVCAKEDCSNCPSDCANTDCNGNNACDIKMGENCINSKDCTCKENEEECNPSSNYSRPNGCAPITNYICGNGMLENGENSTNCCIDAGCAQGQTCLAPDKTKVNVTFSKVYYNPREYTCTLAYCGNGIIDQNETQDNCCIDTGCNQGECIKSDINAFKCVNKAQCGNGIKEGNENSINCCTDAGCPNGLTCTGNNCIKEAVTLDANACINDSDCLCFKGCGSISKTYALTNPSCNNNFTCANTLPRCEQGKCVMKLESINDNQVIKYVSIINELKYRLQGLEPKVLNLIDFLNRAYNYYINNNDTTTANKFDTIANDAREFYTNYISLINDCDTELINPTQEAVNYLSNKIESVNAKLITIISSINAIEINGVTVQELLSGGSAA